MSKMLSEFEESAKHLDRNSRVSECENSIKFLEAKVKKLEMICKNIPAHYVMPMGIKKKVNELTCGKCKNSDEEISSLKKKLVAQRELYEKKIENSVNVKKAHWENLELQDKTLRFLLMRVVGVYGNKALIDLMKHVENPDLSEERLAQYMKVKPHF